MYVSFVVLPTMGLAVRGSLYISCQYIISVQPIEVTNAALNGEISNLQKIKAHYFPRDLSTIL